MANSADEVNDVTDVGQSDQESADSKQYDFVVFYSESDIEEAYRIAEYLEDEHNGSFKGFLEDRDATAGGMEMENLDYALKNCKAYIMLISKSFLECKFKTFTLLTGLDTSVKDPIFSYRLLPLLVDTEMPFLLGTIQGIPFSPKDDVFWAKLKKSLKYMCSQSS